MKRCRACLHLTAGDPLFCPSCGGSYNKRICPKGHENTRTAKACGECGSRDLSTAHPRRTVALIAGFALLRVILGTALVAGTVAYAITFAEALIRDPGQLLPRMLVGAGIALCWLAFVLIVG